MTYCIIGLFSFLVIHLLRSKFKISRLYNTIFSILILVVFASILSYLKLTDVLENIFIIFIFDFIYTTYVLEEDFFNKRDSNTIYYLFLILLGLFLNNSYFNKVDNVFLTGEDIRLIVWILLVIFLYRFIKEQNIFEKNYHTNKMLDEGNILTMFTKLRRRYLNDIKVTDLKKSYA